MPGTTPYAPPSAAAPAGAARAATAVLLGAWALLAGVHLASGAAGRIQLWPPSYLLLHLMAAASLGLRAWRDPGPGRRAWWLLTTASLLDGLNVLRTVLQVSGRVPFPVPGPSNLLNLLLGGFLLGGILAFPRNPDRRGLGRRGALDALLFAASLLFLLWAAGIQGSLSSASQGVAMRVFVAYLNVALLGGALMFVIGNRPDLARGPLGWLVAAVLSWLAALSLWTLAGLPAVIDSRPWIVLAGGTPVFEGLAAWSVVSVQPGWHRQSSDRGLARRLPLLLVGLGILALGVLLIWAPGKVTRGTYALFLVMVALLLVRMLQAIQELRAARNSLEERVRQRTRALEQAQDTLLRAERMNAVATLGAGLTHDLNNFLGVIHTSTELALAAAEEGRPVTGRELRRILEASEQAGSLTRRLMAYGRREPGPELGPRDLAETVAAMRDLLRMLLPREITLAFELPPGMGTVRVDSAVLEQVLVNLVGNAKDAMPGGGAVSIRLLRGAMPSGGPAVLLEVGDSGPGIPEHLREVVFDPFFTTKAAGQGTGLGLASVATLMAAQGGAVTIASEPGQGAVLRLAFPLNR